MGFLDKLRKGATKAVDQHGDKIARGLDKAAGPADKKTKGKYSGQIRGGVDRTKEGLDRLDDKRDNDLGGPSSPDDRPGDRPDDRPPGSTPS
jgi:MT0933-like antitoxin protein